MGWMRMKVMIVRVKCPAGPKFPRPACKVQRFTLIPDFQSESITQTSN